MGDIIEIHQRRFFTVEEARDLLPVIRRVTKECEEKFVALNTKLNFSAQSSTREAAEEEIRCLVQNWQDKVRRLGCEAKGLWLVDFDHGDGYYCWRYPEIDIQYHHSYTEGFGGRTPLH